MSGPALQWQLTPLAEGRVISGSLETQGRKASFAQVLTGWRDDDGFRRQWARWLADIPMPSYCWEMPPLTTSRLLLPFECVFVESPALAVPAADPTPFEDFFPDAPTERDAVIFPNLGGDALLVAPTPQGEASAYPHLAQFLRTAPEQQTASIWKTVTEAVQRRLGAAPLWISTAGLGVAWLHIRIDSAPKYYRHWPYARWDK